MKDNIHVFLASAIALCLPVNSSLIPPLIILSVFLWLSDPLVIVDGCRALISNKAVVPLVLLFVLYAIGILYSGNKAEGGQILETKLSLIILPLIFSTRINSCKENLDRYLYFFIYGCIVSAFICFGWALYCFLKPVYVTIDNVEYDLGASYFYYARLSAFLHPSYISMYFNFALLTMYYFVSKGAMKMNWLWISVAFLFTVFVLLLSSKAGWIGLFLIAAFVVLKLCFNRMFAVAAGILIVLSTLFYCLNMSAPAYSQRITAATQSVSNSGETEELKKSSDGTASRILVWEAAIDIIKEHFLIGTGTGDAKKVMCDKYLEKGMLTEYEHKLNSHDQYLNTFVAIGIGGFVCLLLTLFFPLFYGLKQKQFLPVALVGLTGLNFLFESMLETQAGVMFFAFFQSVLGFAFFSPSYYQNDEANVAGSEMFKN